MGCEEILSELQDILRWLKRSLTGIVFDEEPEGQGNTEDGDDDWFHFEAGPSQVEHWE